MTGEKTNEGGWAPPALKNENGARFATPSRESDDTSLFDGISVDNLLVSSEEIAEANELISTELKAGQIIPARKLRDENAMLARKEKQLVQNTLLLKIIQNRL